LFTQSFAQWSDAGSNVSSREHEVPPEKTIEAVVDNDATHKHPKVSRIHEFERRLAQWHRKSALNQRLVTIAAIGVMNASAIAATVENPQLFK
jgi:hypothetical protein